jgi:hypothetical protein
VVDGLSSQWRSRRRAGAETGQCLATGSVLSVAIGWSCRRSSRRRTCRRRSEPWPRRCFNHSSKESPPGDRRKVDCFFQSRWWGASVARSRDRCAPSVSLCGCHPGGCTGNLGTVFYANSAANYSSQYQAEPNCRLSIEFSVWLPLRSRIGSRSARTRGLRCRGSAANSTTVAVQEEAHGGGGLAGRTRYPRSSGCFRRSARIRIETLPVTTTSLRLPCYDTGHCSRR